MAFVPLAPLYMYVAGVDKAKAYRVTDEELDEMCRLLVEGLEAGACGWSAQIAGEVGNVQLDYDGTPMVTDCMTDREVVAFCARARQCRPGGRPADGHARHRGAHGPRERPARSSGTRCSPTVRSISTAARQYSHRDALKQLAVLQRGGRAARLRAGAHDELRLGVHVRGLQPARHHPGLEGSAPRHGRGEAGQARRSGAPAGHEGHPRASAAGSSVPGYVLDEIKVNWISSDAPNAQEIKERYEGFTIGEIAAREQQALRSTPCSTSRSRATSRWDSRPSCSRRHRSR